jgi:hypothetical protein
MKKTVSILISCLLGGLLLTETCAASICETKESVIFFGNGVKSIKRDARDSIELIEKRLKAELLPEEYKGLEFDIAYNGTHTLPLDLLESVIQMLTGNISKFWRYFFGLDPIPDWFSDKFILLASVLDNSALLTTDSLAKHVNTYKTVIAEGRKVLLVAHSQGNLFGNQTYNLLDSRERQSFGMVSVANVDNNVLGAGSPYTTLNTDKVILALIAAQIALPSRPMPPNTENIPDDSADPLGHSFIQSYMAEGSNSEDKIIQQVITALDSLASPAQIVESGILTVSLTWGSEPDMDLHIYEPNGMQVFWNNLQGYSGALDRDDRTGYGPEHYNVPSCDTLEGGTYRIALDYFKGDGPEVATLQIQAGQLVRTYEIAMGSEYYGSPEYPTVVANIGVKSGENGGYDFEIYK